MTNLVLPEGLSRTGSLAGTPIPCPRQGLVAIETAARTLARRLMHPHGGDVVEPLPSLVIEIGVVDECARLPSDRHDPVSGRVPETKRS
jgi:hypothetical protein